MHDEDTRSSSPSESQKIFLQKPAGSGLTLIIPSLKSLKASQITAKKTNIPPSSVSRSSSVYQDAEPQDKKPPRPVKLKPLKEVLSKLIAQIKRFDSCWSLSSVAGAHFTHRKDDYAFFLRPVHPANVPGYTDVIKYPMDFGTMTNKVNRGRYRSLDEFTVSVALILQQILNLFYFSQISSW